MKKEGKLKHYILYTYSLSNQPKSIRVRFVYLLKGRGKDQGIVQQLKGKFLVPGCFTLPIKKDKEMQEIFQKWKIKFKRIPMLTY
ncbi:hypothetical protein KY331_01940 [Candidatus Woesearchaeota archaeon]|nr:hypothetical protein [Candidatus Woesearchaeota archaeon]